MITLIRGRGRIKRYICLFRLFYFISIDIKVPRELIVAQSHLSVNAGYLDKQWNYPNFLNASCHYRNIVPHIHAFFSATRCERSLVKQQNILNLQLGYLNWVSSQKLGIGFKFTDDELPGQFFRKYSLLQVKDPPPPPFLIATVPIDPELTTP